MLTQFGGSRIVLAVVFCLCTLLTMSAPPAWSQATSNSTVAGLVTDEQGALIVGAEVRLVDAATNSVHTTLSNESGRYVIANLSPATYVITITKPGFAVYRISAQKVDVGTALTIDASLKVSATATTVEVSEHIGAELQTSNAAVGS